MAYENKSPLRMRHNYNPGGEHSHPPESSRPHLTASTIMMTNRSPERYSFNSGVNSNTRSGAYESKLFP